jgi:hypothetical protein
MQQFGGQIVKPLRNASCVRESKGSGMPGIARKIELYNLSFQLARDHVAKDTALNGIPDVVKQLHDAIRRELNSGSDDAVAIAASAVRALQQQYQGKI